MLRLVAANDLPAVLDAARGLPKGHRVRYAVETFAPTARDVRAGAPGPALLL